MTYDIDTRPACDCPADLCMYSECYGSPSATGGFSRHLGLRLLGVSAACLGIAGAVLPLLPTTPFLLIASWAFARSSPRLDAWLRAHPLLGPPLSAWERRRAIPRGAKLLAVASLSASWLLLWTRGGSPLVLGAAAAVMLLVGAWIVTRPS
jgi:uncharacterized membrane protein YbaN (DUF454 family)